MSAEISPFSCHRRVNMTSIPKRCSTHFVALTIVLFLLGLDDSDRNRLLGCHASPLNNISSRRHHHRLKFAAVKSISTQLSWKTNQQITIFRGGASSNASSSSTIWTILPTWSHKILAGGSSRALAQAILYPVDALRTLAQTRDGRTLADVGMKALVRGCAQTSSFALFTGAAQFGIFAAVLPYTNPFIASTCSAAGSCLVSVPQEVIKQRLVTGVYSSFREAVKTIWKTEGILGYYSAWRPTVSRNVPFVITTFTCRDIFRKKLLQYKQQKQHDTMNNKKKKKSIVETLELTTIDNLLIGITSALIGGIVTQPIDVIKTRMMTQSASIAIPYTSALNCAITILKHEGGLSTLYSGFQQRSIYMCGLWGITFAVEPILTNYLENMKKSN